MSVLLPISPISFIGALINPTYWAAGGVSFNIVPYISVADLFEISGVVLVSTIPEKLFGINKLLTALSPIEKVSNNL